MRSKALFLFIEEQEGIDNVGRNTKSDNMDVRRMNILRHFENSSFFT